MLLKLKYSFAVKSIEIEFVDGDGERFLSDYAAFVTLGTPSGGTYQIIGSERVDGVTFNFTHIVWVEHKPIIRGQ